MTSTTTAHASLYTSLSKAGLPAGLLSWSVRVLLVKTATRTLLKPADTSAPLQKNSHLLLVRRASLPVPTSLPFPQRPRKKRPRTGSSTPHATHDKTRTRRSGDPRICAFRGHIGFVWCVLPRSPSRRFCSHPFSFPLPRSPSRSA